MTAKHPRLLLFRMALLKRQKKKELTSGAKLIPHDLHERFKGLGGEVELDVCGGKKLRQGAAAPQAFGTEQVVDGLFRVFLEVCPHLQGSNLGDSVLDVVERALENVELLLPEVSADRFQARIVDACVVAVHDFVPDVGAVAGRVLRETVDAVLEAVHAGYPGE